MCADIVCRFKVWANHTSKYQRTPWVKSYRFSNPHSTSPFPSNPAPNGERLVKIGAKVVRHGRYVTFQMAATVQPAECAFHDPALGEDLENFGRVRTLHDLERCAGWPIRWRAGR